MQPHVTWSQHSKELAVVNRYFKLFNSHRNVFAYNGCRVKQFSSVIFRVAQVINITTRTTRTTDSSAINLTVVATD